MTFYGLRHRLTKRPLGFSTESNEGHDYCVSVAFAFEEYPLENVWLVPDRETAEKALLGSTPWYNAGYAKPQWKYVPLLADKYEVFAVDFPEGDVVVR